MQVTAPSPSRVKANKRTYSSHVLSVSASSVALSGLARPSLGHPLVLVARSQLQTLCHSEGLSIVFLVKPSIYQLWKHYDVIQQGSCAQEPSRSQPDVNQNLGFGIDNYIIP